MNNIIEFCFRKIILDNLDKSKSIKVNLRNYTTSGTVQDDPFDEWTSDQLKKKQSEYFVHHAGKLSSPDIVVIDKTTKDLCGIEVKKLDADSKGNDPRGLTLDYNSTVPCGFQEIKFNEEITKIKVFYFFALVFKKKIITSILCDGNFLNSDFKFHKDSKISNESTYGHGSYGEASIRHRKMYNFPNPLNSKINLFYKNHSVIYQDEIISEKTIKKYNLRKSIIKRQEHKGSINVFNCLTTNNQKNLNTMNLFADTKKREPKKRSAYMVSINYK